MTSYGYEALNNVGKTVKGSVDAENEEQVKEICEKYGFVPAMNEVTVPKQLRADVQNGASLQLLPGIHACDGFFIARLRKED